MADLQPQPRLGRLFARDEHDHILRAAVSEDREPRSKIWPMFSRWLDQGNTGTCVLHGWRHYLTGTPKPLRNPLPTPFELYDEAISIDEWTDNDHDTARQFGTSVRAGAKVLQRRGLIEGYGFTHSVEAAASFLSWHGPMVGGFNFYDSMYERDASGFMEITDRAQIVGGHAFLIHGWDQKRGAAVCLNSWYNFGRFLLAGETLRRLINEYGELCSPQELIHKRA